MVVVSYSDTWHVLGEPPMQKADRSTESASSTHTWEMECIKYIELVEHMGVNPDILE